MPSPLPGHYVCTETVRRDCSRNGWNLRVVPLSKIQTEVLRIIAQHRDPQSYVAGASPLNRAAPRFSQDIDLFSDSEERMAAAADADAGALTAAGYTITWVRRLPAMFTAEVAKGDAATRLEWVVDSDFLARVRAALDEAETFVQSMPTEKLGALFLKDGRVVQPDPDRLDEYEVHHGRRGGHWPSDPKIMRAMLEEQGGALTRAGLSGEAE